jgi:acyl-CoA reductase-like NAD-dependent aldehyde dehydrogenase
MTQTSILGLDVRQPLMTIDGRAVSGSQMSPVINPATAEPFLEVPSASVSQLDHAVAAARAAAPAWAAKLIEERRDLVMQMAVAGRDNIAELARLLTLEHGKPLPQATWEIDYVLSLCESFAGMDLPVDVIRDDAAEYVSMRRTPIGVVGAIAAWNFPMLSALLKVAPALIAGNTIIVKPSPFTPATTLRFGEIAAQVLPAGTLQVLSGGNDLGRAIAQHPGIDKIAFTGSVDTGRAVMAAAAGSLKRITLELGGNDAGIVLDDVDPSATADALIGAAMGNCGQNCVALKRLFVPESKASAFQEALAAAAAVAPIVGDGLTPGVTMGPIQNAPQLDKVTRLLADSVTGGADVVFRGQAPAGPGYFYPVTIVRCDTDELPLVSEEQFGPILPVLTYRDVDEAVSRANASRFGLGASVWSTDEDRAGSVADRLEAGTVWINHHPSIAPDVPFGGVEQSGIGVESSRHGLFEFTNISVRKVRH